MSQYVLDNAHGQTEQRFASLQDCFDPITIAHLERTGVTAGWRCLEVGGGGGSIGRWLAAQVGETGSVMVTDIDPRWIGDDQPSNLTLERHDIVRDPLPEASFDLIHARLVLLHLPERDAALASMVRALKPGGWLLIDDFDATWLPFVADCEPAGQALFHKVIRAFERVLRDGDVDLKHGRYFHPLLTDHGLINVQVDGHTQVSRGGTAGTKLHQSNIEQLAPKLLESNLLTRDEIQDFLRLLDDEHFSVNSYLLVSGLGQRPDLRTTHRRPTHELSPA